MTSYLVDTNVISEVTKKKPNGAVLNWLLQHEDELYLPTITIEELRFGEHMLPKGKRRNRLHEQINALVEQYASRTLSFDAYAAEVCADLHEKAIVAGRTPKTEDLMIAATALSRGYTLVTRNTRDFDYLDIPLINPFQPE